MFNQTINTCAHVSSLKKRRSDFVDERVGGTDASLQIRSYRCFDKSAQSFSLTYRQLRASIQEKRHTFADLSPARTAESQNSKLALYWLCPSTSTHAEAAATLSFVIPTEAERSGGICSFTFGHSETVPWADHLQVPLPHQHKLQIPHDASRCPKHFQERSGELQIPRLRSPGFPVEIHGADSLHAPFFTERRTRGPVQCCVAGNPGRDDKGEGDASMESGLLNRSRFSPPMTHSG